jgi:beta-glucosidase
MLSRFSSYTGVKKIVVTENGASFKDELKDGRVEDPRRLRYLQCYLEAVLSAKRDGARVGGYFVWTFTDNFEWAEGYYPRFGLVYVDFPTQERILKSSGHWFSQFLE